MRSVVNKETIIGRIYDFTIDHKVSGPGSKNPGTKYIGGNLEIATDEECLNIVTIQYRYVTPTYKSGKENQTYTVLAKIIEEGQSIVKVGKEDAMMVRCTPSLALNDFYSNRNGGEEDELVSVKINDGGFVNIIKALPEDENKRNTFEYDFFINAAILKEADGETIDEDYMILRGAVFNFKNDILPVELTIRTPAGIKYFENQDISKANPFFTKVWGQVTSKNLVRKIEKETAFGDTVVEEYNNTIKEWLVTRAAIEPYEIGKDITGEEIKKALADREVYLADVKRRGEEYRAQQAEAKKEQASTGFDDDDLTVSAEDGDFDF